MYLLDRQVHQALIYIYIYIYNGLADGTQIGLGSTEYITDRLSELAITDDVLPLNYNTISIGSLTDRWSEVYASNGVIVTSDLTLKEQVNPLKYGVEQLLELNPVHYKWKEERFGKTIAKPEEKIKKIGFLAQELKEVLPEVVEDQVWVKSDNGTFIKTNAPRKGVYYHEILPVVISAIKTHQKDLNAVKKQTKKIEELLKKIEH